MAVTPISWPHPPRDPSGDWGVTLPGNASIGEVLVYGDAAPFVPSYGGHYLHNVFGNPQQASPHRNAGGVGNVALTSLEVAVHVQLANLTLLTPLFCRGVKFNSLNMRSQIAMWTDSGTLVVDYTDSGGAYHQIVGTLPTFVTTLVWVWFRVRLDPAGTGLLISEASPSDPFPSSWTPVASVTLASIPVGNYNAGDLFGIGSSDYSHPNPPADLNIREVRWQFNAGTAQTSTFETTASVSGATVTDDTGGTWDTTSQAVTCTII